MTGGDMQLIGMLGGMSWESSAIYYRLINRSAHRLLGGHHNARSVLFTVDFSDLYGNANEGRWDRVAAILSEAARRVEQAGAAFVMLTAVTAHAVADRVQAELTVPMLHIADPTAEAIRQAGISRVGLLATRYTMDMGFLADRLKEVHGIDVMLPTPEQRAALHAIIIEELTLGLVKDSSRAALLAMTADLARRGAQAAIVGCTELPLLAATEDYPIPAFDMVTLHAEAAVRKALAPKAALTQS